MSDPSQTQPNSAVREVYEQLGALLKHGDDVFVEKGPALLQKAIQKPGFFERVETKPASQREYTQTKVIGDSGRYIKDDEIYRKDRGLAQDLLRH